jgi:acyl carrier protein
MKWTREAIRSEILTLLGQHTLPGTDVTEASHLAGDLGIDSLGVMEILADVEDKYQLNIPDAALKEVETVGDVVTAIVSRLERDGRLQG